MRFSTPHIEVQAMNRNYDALSANWSFDLKCHQDIICEISLKTAKTCFNTEVKEMTRNLDTSKFII